MRGNGAGGLAEDPYIPGSVFAGDAENFIPFGLH
jgi:hypothetical protein